MPPLNRVNARTVGLLCLVFAFLSPWTATAQDPKNFGAMWRASAPNAQRLYVGGLQEGAVQVVLLARALSDSLPPRNEREAQHIRLAELTPSQRNNIAAIAQARYRAYSTEGIGLDPVCRAVTTLYQDPANTLIPWSEITRVAIMRLTGSDEAAVRDELRVLRRVSTSRP